MADLNLNGKEQGINWSIEPKTSTLGGFHAVVKVGSKVRVTGNFEKIEDARDAGCQLMADTFAELEDLVNA